MSVNLKPISPGEVISVDKEVACQSAYIKGMFDDDEDCEEIDLNTIQHATLKKVVEFLIYLKANGKPEIKTPITSVNLEDSMKDQKFYLDFINNDVDQELLFNMVLAAQFMKIQELNNLCCSKIACNIKG